MDFPAPVRAPISPAVPDVLPGADSRRGGNRSVEAVAGQFESLFLSLVLKEMRQTLEPGALFGEDRADVCGGLFDLYLGQHLAKAGGFGLAAMLKRQLKTAAPDNDPIVSNPSESGSGRPGPPHPG